MKKQFRSLTRKIRSVGQACVFRLLALSGLRGPSSTCQVSGLKEIFRKCLGETQRGVFVEVGAYDGEKFSNTSWLADNGWTGIYVEPSAEFSTLCRLRHMLNRVVVVNAAAGDTPGEATLMQMGSLSTMSMSTFDAYQTIPWAKNQMATRLEQKAAQIRTLNSILEDNACPPGFDVLVVDVEGFEESVFRSFDIKRWRPRMMIVELCDVHQEFSGSEELLSSAGRVRSQILAHGYLEVYRDSINTIFAVPECAGRSVGEKVMCPAA